MGQSRLGHSTIISWCSSLHLTLPLAPHSGQVCSVSCSLFTNPLTPTPIYIPYHGISLGLLKTTNKLTQPHLMLSQNRYEKFQHVDRLGKFIITHFFSLSVFFFFLFGIWLDQRLHLLSTSDYFSPSFSF